MSLYTEKKNISRGQRPSEDDVMFMMDDDDFVKKYEVLDNQVVDICSICFETCVEFTYKCST